MNDDPTYIEKIRQQFWDERKPETFRANWKSTVGEFRVGTAINEHNKRSELPCSDVVAVLFSSDIHFCRRS